MLFRSEIVAASAGIERVGEVPIYAADALVRRASSLQKTVDAKNAKRAWLATDVAANLGVANGMEVRVTQDGNSVTLTAAIDAGLAAGCVRVAASLPETAALGAMFGTINIEKVALAAAAE